MAVMAFSSLSIICGSLPRLEYKLDEKLDWLTVFFYEKCCRLRGFFNFCPNNFVED